MKSNKFAHKMHYLGSVPLNISSPFSWPCSSFLFRPVQHSFLHFSSTSFLIANFQFPTLSFHPCPVELRYLGPPLQMSLARSCSHTCTYLMWPAKFLWNQNINLIYLPVANSSLPIQCCSMQYPYCDCARVLNRKHSIWRIDYSLNGDISSLFMPITPCFYRLIRGKLMVQI